MASDNPARRPNAANLAAFIPLLIIACAILVVVGSIGPWAGIAFITANGTEGDGRITLVLGLAAGVAALVSFARPRDRRILAIPAVLFAVAAGIGIYDWNNLDSIVTINDIEIPFVDVEARWGLIVMTLSACVGAVLSVAGMVFTPAPKQPGPEPAPPQA
jgi:TRAP-type C4-dicarboxylate transport system permease small subunit